jgi:uncharacterized repeat protein (TIGR03803 family)
MKSNPFWAAVSKALAVTTATLIMALILAPGASAAGKYKVLYKFTGGTDGSQPEAGLILDTSGNLYGTTPQGGAFGDGVVFKLTKNSDGSWTESVLYSFAGGTDGATPYAEVTFDASGNLYGTTYSGGASSAGTVFQLAPNSDGTWTESVLYTFTGGSDGANPYAGVVFDATGTLYGTTYGGGTRGLGVVYKLTPNSNGSWTYGALHSFTGGKDGSHPQLGNLTFDTAGNLYGATNDGVDGYGDCPNGNDCGSIVELTPQSDGSWKEKVIFRFTGGTTRNLNGTLVFDSAGRLYGNSYGGDSDYGTVFMLTLGAKGKWWQHVLYVFQGNQDGAYPIGGVVFDTAGTLYGTTVAGINSHGGVGQLFKLVPRRWLWKKYVPHFFEGPPRDGGDSPAPVVFDAAGNLYGTAFDGWNTGCCGVVFEYIK